MKRWLHISDLHFNNDDMSTSMLREELPEFLKRKNFTFDYIFCTGDVRTAPDPFPGAAVDYLKNLCSVTQTDISNLFIVPGNHDVNRAVSGRDKAIRRVHFKNKGYYNPKYGVIKEEDLSVLMSGTDDFRGFLSSIYPPERVEKYRRPHFVIETEDFNVLHVDTTLVQTKNQEANDLIIGTKLIQDVLKNINDKKPIILITHFPFTSLLQDEKKYIRELLYSKGVCLWLAGHEHDHNIQTIGYLSSAQAGELRMEERTSASFLVGEHEKLAGTITAYNWFPEGWAKYPLIFHDGTKEDEFPFTLRLSEDNGQSREAVKASQMNKEFFARLPETVIEELLPAIEYDDGRNATSLVDELIGIWNTPAPHLILRADGGMGKTTMMLDACRKMVSLYIPAERLEAINSTIKEYCARALYDGDVKKFEEYVSKKYSSPSLVLLIDGLNEIDGGAERKFINEIKALSLLKGIQFVVSSRSDFTARYSMAGYRMGRLQPLSDERLQSVFSESEWEYINDTVTLHRLLTNPMMVTMYKEVSPVISKYRDIEFLDWITPIKNTTDLLHNYYVSQIAVMLSRTGTGGEQALEAAQILYDILPEIAYTFESRRALNIKNKEFRIIVRTAMESYHPSVDLEPMQEFFRCYDVPELKAGSVIDFLVERTHLLYRDTQLTTFPHQIYRDYLSACWIVKKTAEKTEELWNSRSIPFPLMEHIRNLSGEYWNGIAACVHEAGKGRKDTFNLVGNLLDCFPASETSGHPDYSGLSFEGLQIPDTNCKEGRISLESGCIDEVSIGKTDIQPQIYKCIQFSPDNSFLACVSNGRLLIYTLDEGKELFSYFIGGNTTKLLFEGKYLFAVAKGGLKSSLTVFSYDGEWDYVGEIRDADNWHIFNNRLRFIILKDDVLHFYYNNRECRYSLADCRRIYNKGKEHVWENPVDGIMLDIPGEKRAKKKKGSAIVERHQHGELIATSYVDGGLVITSGNEIQYILSRGVTLLKDGSIAGNGSRAVTLGYDISNGKRKVQIWNLNDKVREGEILCPETIEKIHLSDTGEWILGETIDSTWVYNLESSENTWYDEHFISNQRRKLTTYGDKVLRKDKDNLLYLYNIRTKEREEVDNLSKNARIACFMPDGSVAMVGNNAWKLKFRNSRTGEYAEIDTKGSVILGVQALTNKPFIAVATDDRKINIYHTATLQCTRHLEAENCMMVVHPELNVVAGSSGAKSFSTYNFFEWEAESGQRGKWYSNPYGEKKDPDLNGDVLDLAFNTEINELVVILTSGQIAFCHEKYCRFHDMIDIITSFNVDAYDFMGVSCGKNVRKILQDNGALIDDGIYTVLIHNEAAARRTIERLKHHAEHNDVSPDMSRFWEYGIPMSLEGQTEIIRIYDEAIEEGLNSCDAWKRILR